VSDGRPGWDQWAMGIAFAVAVRGDCTRRKVGTVIIDKRRRIVSWGYNGTAPGRDGCLKGACPRGRYTEQELPPGPPYDTPGSKGYCIATHSEMNALIDADPDRLIEAVLYCTSRPCPPCTKVIANTAIRRIVYPAISFTDPKDFFLLQSPINLKADYV
jgi:dCMP deaminase